MPRTHPPYPIEFRNRMIDLIRAGRTPEELAQEFEPTAQTIRNWVTQADRDNGQRHDGFTTAEREILAIAAAWFAQETHAVPNKHSRS
jgi:transposase